MGADAYFYFAAEFEGGDDKIDFDFFADFLMDLEAEDELFEDIEISGGEEGLRGGGGELGFFRDDNDGIELGGEEERDERSEEEELFHATGGARGRPVAWTPRRDKEIPLSGAEPILKRHRGLDVYHQSGPK